MTAVERATLDPNLHSPDLGGTARTDAVTNAVINAVADLPRQPSVNKMASAI